MKRIDRSSKGHYESETASRTATLGVHNLFEPYSNKLPIRQNDYFVMLLAVGRSEANLGEGRTRVHSGCGSCCQ